ncbi:MAG: GHKL domain-containing protein [Epsilonproteobacteria bacterium]|nr:GHKL domain-containing protein [Campylobacterota bacterium]
MERFFKDRSINQANIITLLFSGSFAVLLTALMVYNSYIEYISDVKRIKEEYLKSQKELIKIETNRALRFIKYKANHPEGKSKKELQKEIVEAIEHMRNERDGTGYIFIYTFDGVNIADPILKQNAGKNLLNFKDPNGKKVIYELIEVSKQDDGGYVKYFWNKPIVNKLSPKISYAKAYKPWRWMVGSGVYLDDVQKVLKKREKEYKKRVYAYITQIFLFALVLFIGSMLIYRYVTYLITKDIRYIQNKFKTVFQNYDIIDREDLIFKEFREISKYANQMITQMREKTEAIKNLNKTLEKKVQDKTKMLEVAKNRAEELLNMQDRFVKNAIHEINTPLSIILVNIELYNLKYKKNHYLTKIEAGIKIIHNIYNDLSYLVKKNELVYEKKVIDFSDFLKERIEFFNDVALGNSLKIDFEIEDGRKIEFNETKLQRVCDNNISNAIKYSFENSTIFIKLYKEADKVVFYIENHGEKIKDKEKLFDRFYREDEARGGFGLGLNIVKDICEENQVDIKTIFEEGKNIFIYTFKGIT